MNWKIELIFVPVTDVDRAKAFYVDQVGFNADFDQTVSDEIRFVQLTPPAPPARSPSAAASATWSPARSAASRWSSRTPRRRCAHLVANGVDASDVDPQPWGRFVTFSDPDGNRWTLQELVPQS